MASTCSIPKTIEQEATPVTTKAAILIMSDPRSGSDEALGRLFNGLAAAYDFTAQGVEVCILFHGAGTRWVGALADAAHPAYTLFQAVKDRVKGVSCGCADVFGASSEVETSGFELIKDNAVPGTSGLPSLPKLIGEGYTVLTF